MSVCILCTTIHDNVYVHLMVFGYKIKLKTAPVFCFQFTIHSQFVCVYTVLYACAVDVAFRV